MAGKNEQLRLDGFDDIFSGNDSFEQGITKYNVHESKLMLTSVARQRLNLIVRGDIKNSSEIDEHLESL